MKTLPGGVCVCVCVCSEHCATLAYFCEVLSVCVLQRGAGVMFTGRVCRREQEGAQVCV